MKSKFTCLIKSFLTLSFLQLIHTLSFAQLIPVPINGLSLNHDLVAEGVNNNPIATTSISIGDNYVLYDETFKASHPVITAGGLPASGLITNGLDTWQLRPYNLNNALFFPPQATISSNSIYLITPGQYSRLSLLANSAVGSVTISVSVTFSDDVTTQYGLATVKNWTDESPSVIRGFGAITRSTPIVAQEGTPDQPQLYQIDVNLSEADQLKTVTNINITNTDVSGLSTAAFFAVSGIPILALPITFSSLSAQYQAADKKITLNWEAETALNSPGFEVQRSAEGSVFSSIATVTSKKTVGSTNYSYIDYDLQNRQAWFYRIKEVMAGGTINYSKIINVKTAAPVTLKIIQSGGNLRLTTTLPDKYLTYKIVDLHGRVLKSGTASAANQFAIDINALPSGPYVLNILNHTEIRSIKFVK